MKVPRSWWEEFWKGFIRKREKLTRPPDLIPLGPQLNREREEDPNDVATSKQNSVYARRIFGLRAHFRNQHEYLGGLIYTRAGASPAHNQICFNTTGELYAQLKGTDCFGFTSDQRMRTDLLDLFSYPDITIVCGEPLFHHTREDVILNPKVIIEILSPSTEAYDRGEKFARYQPIKTLSDYILIAQDRPSIEHFTRQQGKREWLYSRATEMQAEIHIASINCRLKLADVYDRLRSPPPQPRLVPVSAQEVKEKLAAQKPERRHKS